MTIPNILSLFRILLIPVAAYLLLIDHIELSFALYTICAITDFLDGLLARLLNQFSELGKILDPIGDKLLVLIMFSVFLGLHIVPRWFFIIIIAKDILLFIGFIEMRQIMRTNMVLSPTRLSKFLTFLNMLIIGFFYLDLLGIVLPFNVSYFIVIAGVLTVFNIMQYGNLWLSVVESNDGNL